MYNLIIVGNNELEVNYMKKTVIILLILMNIVTVDASGNEPKYKIIANSNSDEDIETMYEIKDSLIKDYQQWVKSVDDVDQALADHQKNYNAKLSITSLNKKIKHSRRVNNAARMFIYRFI